eukprot:2019569-Pleurochrysis_carterae.AAC.2
MEGAQGLRQYEPFFLLARSSRAMTGPIGMPVTGSMIGMSMDDLCTARKGLKWRKECMEVYREQRACK